jgi:hypothetical protein
MTTRTESQSIRIEKVLPYLNNVQGVTLEDLLEVIDDRLKDASPDALSPGLINWSHKNLFVDKWIVTSGTPIVSYNQFAASKIGKGRFDISGTGTVVYDRYLAISEIRGVIGRIFIGATAAGANVTVGAECYDADKNYLGNNGGFVTDNYEPEVNQYNYFKSSCFGEAVAGTRFLKPNTRFVRIFIRVDSNSSIVFFDESELTTFELDERYLQFFGTEIDWNRAEFFYTELTGNNTFTFKNDIDGRVKNVIIKNTGIGNIQVTFPTAKWQGGVALDIVRPGRTSIFSFIKAGAIVYAAVIEELE